MKQKEIDDIAHNINNPLQIIELEMVMLKRSGGDNSEINKIIDIVQSQVKRIAKYVKSLKEDQNV
jgi:hypothetical protein